MNDTSTDERYNLGPCCVCGKEDSSVRNIVMLSKKALNPEGTWGCVICGIWGGAVAVLCDDCAGQGFEIKFVCDGYPTDKKRIPIDQLTEDFGHDLRLHPGPGNHWMREIGRA